MEGQQETAPKLSKDISLNKLTSNPNYKVTILLNVK